ncbi:E3 ubiquitin-protein ligase RNF114 isoform X2 [Paramormyrops kingsleyae]|uniref:E3 ubiquitin-protein ligase RNF114 isoform X2 n=1 Tax=Paramormyrops kingsleyae TaxID=1676925 RepID=UPI000CD62C67|nr:E3 ubiquitin-protein ligase RNF114 isoform X2 [Paramormyrops kingsleyae]
MAMIGAPDPAARSGSTADGEGDSSDFTCPVCLEIFDRPVTTQCGHTFCNSCLQECLRTHKPICAVCRTTLDKWVRATAIETLIQKNTGPCKGCQTQVRLSQMRSHTAVCSKYQEYIDEGVRSTTQSQPAVSSVPNRFTFSCPYCNFQNLDQDGLVEHCTSLHARDTRHVVCPICASMPWGDPNYRSADFFQHLKIRHTFSYDTFVDYSADEHTMIQEALQRSLMDK